MSSKREVVWGAWNSLGQKVVLWEKGIKSGCTGLCFSKYKRAVKARCTSKICGSEIRSL